MVEDSSAERDTNARCCCRRPRRRVDTVDIEECVMVMFGIDEESEEDNDGRDPEADARFWEARWRRARAFLCCERREWERDRVRHLV